jgi:hypothetical protein
MSNWAFVALAFGLTWAVLIGYTVSIHRRARQAQRLLDAALAQPSSVALAEPACEAVTRTAVEVVR